MSEYHSVIQMLQQHADEHNVQSMSRFGINTKNALGISIVTLRKMVKPYKKNHELAVKLWASGIHEARLFAVLIDEPEKVTEQQFDQWSNEVDSWDLCDQMCSNLFSKSVFAEKKIMEYAGSEHEFVKRTAFALIACFALKRMNKSDEFLLRYLPLIEQASDDPRNFVRKAVNWALRQIGKKNPILLEAATITANRILEQNTKPARWIANDALREFAKKSTFNPT